MMNTVPQTYPNGMQQNPQPFQQNTNITFVNGIEGAKAYQLSPNSSVLLMDSDNSKFYVKSTDNLGVPKLTSYSFAEDDLSVKSEQSASIPPESTVVSNADLEALMTKVSELEDFKKLVESKIGDLF